VLEPRVHGHVERGLSVFLLAAPPHAGVAQLRLREYLFTGEPICYLDNEPCGRSLDPLSTRHGPQRSAQTSYSLPDSS
jgi:hypothetical protein